MIKTLGLRIGACALLATTALVSIVPVQALAQAAAQVTFDIPAGDTASALNAFSRQAGVQLMFPAGSFRTRTMTRSSRSRWPTAARNVPRAAWKARCSACPSGRPS
jgi:hypothetical protein